MNQVTQISPVTDDDAARMVRPETMADLAARIVATPVDGSPTTRHRAPRERRARNVKRGLLAGIPLAGAAAAAAAVLATTSTPPPATPAAAPAATPTRSASQAPAATSKLMSLAVRIEAADNGSLPGNASLQILDHISGGKVWDVSWGLYTDSGDMYTGGDQQTLMTAVADHENEADGADREVAAARDAATGDLAAARMRMLNTSPNDFFLSPAAREKLWKADTARDQALLRMKGIKTPPKMPTGQALQEQINNSLWSACTDALNWAGGAPKIRAGVLRLLSTIPEVAVVDSKTGGQPTLTITGGPTVFGSGGDEVLTVNATTGLPVSIVSTAPGMSAVEETFQISRVTLADIKAGKF
jgi:hypothetical protein